MNAEQTPNVADRQVLIKLIARLAIKTKAPDPELYAMMYVATPYGRINLDQWRHVRNMAAVQLELVTNAETASAEQVKELEAIEENLWPQLNRLRSFENGWNNSSPAFRAAFQDVAVLQQKNYKRDRPSRKVLDAHNRN